VVAALVPPVPPVVAALAAPAPPALLVLGAAVLPVVEPAASPAPLVGVAAPAPEGAVELAAGPAAATAFEDPGPVVLEPTGIPVPPAPATLLNETTWAEVTDISLPRTDPFNTWAGPRTGTSVEWWMPDAINWAPLWWRRVTGCEDVTVAIPPPTLASTSAAAVAPARPAPVPAPTI
jgi:hypothetical protein